MHKEYILLNGFRKAKKDFTAGFHVPLIKETAEQIAPIITHIFQQSYSTSKLPDDWLLVSPIHTKKIKSDPANYRPISLTSRHPLQSYGTH